MTMRVRQGRTEQGAISLYWALKNRNVIEVDWMKPTHISCRTLMMLHARMLQQEAAA